MKTLRQILHGFMSWHNRCDVNEAIKEIEKWKDSENKKFEEVLLRIKKSAEEK